MAYKVDKKVPAPAPPRPSVPIQKLGVGESIKFPREDRSKVQIKASRLKKTKGMAFTVRVEDAKYCRVWRTL